METYSSVLVNLIKSCEDSLGVYNIIKGVNLDGLPIVKYLEELRGRKVSKSEYLEISVSIGDYLSSMCYCNNQFNFEREKVIPFKGYIRLDLLALILASLTSKEEIERNRNKCVIRLVNYLQVQEDRSLGVIRSLAYRLIRLTITLIINNDYVNAYMVSRLLLDQIFLNEDLDLVVKNRLNGLMKESESIEKIAKERNTLSTSKETNTIVSDLVKETETEDERRLREYRERMISRAKGSE